MFSVAVPVLVNVTLFGVLVIPMTVLGKVNLVTESVTAGVPPPPQLPKMKDPMRELQLNVPFTFSYWLVYQKVQSSLGSTWSAV